MFTVAQLNRSARLLATICTPLALAGVLAPTAASAQITETVTIFNNYGTAFPPATPMSTPGGDKVTIYSGNYAPDAESELGVNYTATADQATGNFFFLHDNHCVGTCSTISDTTITFSVTNNADGGDDENVWFHSQITPGHLAEIFNGSGAGARAEFEFQVLRQDRGQEFGTVLYSASGAVNSDGIFLNTGFLNNAEFFFNGRRSLTGENYELIDWQTTNLSINTGFLAPGRTMDIIYQVKYESSGQAACADVFLCPGAQVVFGDPRNNGGVILSSSLASFANLDETAPPPPADPLAVIGADYFAVKVPYLFNTMSTSPFDEPVLQAGLEYGPLYRSRVDPIPEPESWALMILGFGAAGTAMRRQRSRLRIASA